MSKTKQDPSEYIVPLNMNSLHGRMLRVPAPKQKSREILVVYGHHALIERWWGLVQNLNEFGGVTMPDLPGFGGMDSFSKIGQKPTIDNFADYLAAFIKMRYKRQRITIVGISFGFVIATRMLQRYPELAKKVDLLVSIVGFMHEDDFHFKPRTQRGIRLLARFFGTHPVSFIIRYGFLNKPIISRVYARLPAGKRRLIDMEPTDMQLMMDFEVRLWQENDVRTHWLTTSEFLKLDNCKQRVELPVWHIGSKNDHYFNNQIVKEHMLVAFSECNQVLIDAKAHTPSIMADKKELGILLPRKLRQTLAKAPR
jgi:pimeloyl-ACP methyl ester carboxylesterase